MLAQKMIIEAVIKALGKKSRKKTTRSRARTGLAGVPIEKGFVLSSLNDN